MDGRGNSASRTLTFGGTRLLEYTLAVGIFLGSFALWILVPVGSLWIGSLIADDAKTMMLCVLVICPVAMLACGLGLSVLYRAYLRVSEVRPTTDRTAWLGSLSGDRSPKRGRRPVLDFSLTFSAGTAIVLLLVWFLFLAQNFSPAGFVP
ncbi:MAG TPA: hypothetical protein VGC98_07425 [Thermoleophilaceae bacterium]